MSTKTQKAFTMVELIFVIVIIGILSAVAVPKLSQTTSLAYLSKAKSELASVMSAIATHRQKQILSGKASTGITDLGDGTYAFSVFNADSTKEVVSVPVKQCTSGQKGCWTRTDATHYVYSFVDSGDALFKLASSRLICDSDEADCAKLLY